ncbi:TPA: ThiF family adenylyltransferase [Photobacterium damselae]
MTPEIIAGLIESISFKQLVSKQQVDEKTFDFELQGRSIRWNVRLFFDLSFPFSLPHGELLNEEYIGVIPHVNSKGTLCIEEGDSILVDYHSPSKIIETFLYQTLQTLERSSLRIFKDELYDELEGFIHGVDTINSFYKAGSSAEKLVLRIAPSSNLLAPYDVNPIALAKSASDIPCGFSNTKALNKYQLVNIVHVPLSTPIVPPTTNESASDFIAELKQHISLTNLKMLTELLGEFPKKQRQFFVLISMPRNSSERSEFICQFKSKAPSLHPILTDSTDWQLKFFLLNRHNKEYLLERGGASLSINNKAVAIVGCGSVGSVIAMLIAKSGVGTIKLIDGDSLDAENIYRHNLGGRYLNFNPSAKDQTVRKFSKVSALENEIKTNIPHIHIDTFQYPLSAHNVNNIMREVDLVIVSIGNPSISLLLNRSLKEHQFNNVIFCWNEPDGYGGHSAALNLDQVCLECILYNENDSNNSIHLVEFGQPISKNLTGCAGVFTPFSYLDSTKTASLAAQQAITFLTSGNMESKVTSWKGIDTGTLQTTQRFKSMTLMEEISLTKNDECKCCEGSN